MIKHFIQIAIPCMLGFFTFLSMNLTAQHEVIATGEYHLKIESYMSNDEAKEKACAKAKINAIENTFGTIVYQGNTTFIKNSSGQQTESSTVFNSIGGSEVAGEWIQDIDECKFKKETDEKGIEFLYCRVKGRIRELKNAAVTFQANSLSCTKQDCKTTSFNNKQQLFLYFKSPMKGYISVYLDDLQKQETFKLLPYSGSAVNPVCVPVEADKDYIFFSKQFDYFKEGSSIDELELSLQNAQQPETNKLFVLFSPEPFDKPILTNKTNELLDKTDIEKKYTLPMSLKSEEFQHWQQRLRRMNKNVQIFSWIIDIK